MVIADVGRAGRVGITARFVSLGIQPVGFVLGGALIDTLGGTETIAIVGVGMCLLALAFGPARGLRAATVAPASPA